MGSSPASPIQSHVGRSNLSEIRPTDLNIEHGTTPKESPRRPKPNGARKESDGVGYLATSGVEECDPLVRDNHDRIKPSLALTTPDSGERGFDGLVMRRMWRCLTLPAFPSSHQQLP